MQINSLTIEVSGYGDSNRFRADAPYSSVIYAGIRLAHTLLMCKTVPGSVLLLVSAATISSCSGGAMPSSPSALTTLTPLTAPGAGGARVRTLDDPPLPGPTPDPTNPTPNPTNPIPDPTAPPTPMQVIISIIGTFGSAAFAPNPILANMGDMIVWQNNDTRMHHIVLDDGVTDFGDVMPGQASLPTALTTRAATFHCTIHPTMVGSINGELAPEPYMPPPPDDYGGGYGYYGYS